MSDDFKQRVKIEKEELDDKTMALGVFIGSKQSHRLSEVDQILLRVQLPAMGELYRCTPQQDKEVLSETYNSRW